MCFGIVLILLIVSLASARNPGTEPPQFGHGIRDGKSLLAQDADHEVQKQVMAFAVGTAGLARCHG